MTTLLLRLAGPLQAWGTRSRFAYRMTDMQPSKSAILGLLAAASGRRRTDPIEDLLDMRFGVRRDQPGRVITDFQTARSLDGSRTMPLTHRYYLADAVFVAAVEGPGDLVAGLHEALSTPQFPLYLGRRSCPPARRIPLGLRQAPLADVLESIDPGTGVSWQAAPWWRRQQTDPEVTLEIVRDAQPRETVLEFVPDLPLSFDPDHRQYSSRPVTHSICRFANPASPGQSRPGPAIHDAHDPFAYLGWPCN
ncbi:MAG: type I-E CRISPR-associated protein Cas5/CasD [Candidatus Nanopelagicales bacterium]